MHAHQMPVSQPSLGGECGIVLIRDGIVLIVAGVKRLSAEAAAPLARGVARAKARREMAALAADPRLCRDVGLTVDEARRLADRPIRRP